MGRLPHIDLWKGETKRELKDEEIIGKVDNLIFMIKRYFCLPEHWEYEVWVREADTGREKKLKGTFTKKIHAYERGIAVIRNLLKEMGEI